MDSQSSYGKSTLSPSHPTTLSAAVRDYWNTHIHDLEMTSAPAGSPAFFRDLDTYRLDKLHYLPRLVNFTAYNGCDVLEVGCGLGLDLARFARGGAHVTGIDLSETAINLARSHFAQQGLAGDLQLMDGEALHFTDASFDLVYAHGVLQYTANPQQMIAEIHRVLRPGGQAILMVYNRFSWLNALSKVTRVELEHVDAPVLRKYSRREFLRLLAPFHHVGIIPERFPTPTKLHKGWKARLFNTLFVGAFDRLPRPLVRPFGWHLLAFADKHA